MLVYHGSYMEIKKPDINIGRFNLDFGKGFYVTTLQAQAEKWADRKAKHTQNIPIVNIYEFEPDGLNMLVFEGYTEAWLNFVIRNRMRKMEIHEYDAIYGNIADDDVAGVINEYIRLLNKGRVNEDVKKAWLHLLTYSKPNNQYCVASQSALQRLIFKESYKLER